MDSPLNVKALVGAFNQEKALVGAFSVIVQPVVEPMEHYTALVLSSSAMATLVPSSFVCAASSLAFSSVSLWISSVAWHNNRSYLDESVLHSYVIIYF